MKKSPTSSVDVDTASSSSSSCTSRCDPPPALRPLVPPSSDQTTVHFNTFNSSGAPSRILIFKNREWVDVAHKLFDELKEAIVSRKTTVELSNEGNICLFNFITMTLLDLSTNAMSSIGWIDVNGRCFFPEFSHERSPRFPGTKMLSKDDKSYKIVSNLFLDGMVRFAPNATVTSVCKCLQSGFSGELRTKGFAMTMDMMKAARGGNANVRCGWFGAPAKVIAGVIKYGFGMTNDGDLRDEALGVGLHLSSPHFPYAR